MRTKNQEAINFLRHLPIFAALSEEELQQVGQVAKPRKVAKHSNIYQMGDASDQIFFLTKGIVKISNETEGREVIKHVLHPLAIFGELCLVGEQKRQDTAVAMNRDVMLYTINVKTFRALMQTNIQLSMNVLNLIGKRLRSTESRLESMIFKDARARIIDFLKDSAQQQGKRIGYEMLIKHCLTQQDIANITGTSRQTVTSVLNELRKANLIYFNRRSILIRDIGKLA